LHYVFYISTYKKIFFIFRNVENCGCNLRVHQSMQRVRGQLRKSTVDSLSEAKKSMKLLKYIKFVGPWISFHLKNLKIYRMATIWFFSRTFFYFQPIQRNSYFGKFMTFLDSWPHKNCLFYEERKNFMSIGWLVEAVFPPV